MAAVTFNYRLDDFIGTGRGPALLGPFTIANVPQVADSDAVVTLRYYGDFSPGEQTYESFNVQIEGFTSQSFGAIPPNDEYNGVNVVSFTIPQSVLAGIVADGAIDIRYGIGRDVDDFKSIREEYIDLTIDYQGTYVVRPPSTSIDGTSGPDPLTGTDFGDTINGYAGNDTITGYSGNDLINGNQGADVIFANQGNDTIFAGQDDDVAYGGRDNDAVFGNLGNDALFGDKGNDTVGGGQGNDYVRGGQGDDLVFGGAGNDQIWGDLGNDTLSGGTEADVFFFAAGSGNDVIVDFNRAQGDSLNFQGQTYTVSDVNGSAVIALSGGGTVILTGVSSASLDAGAFA
ncbi:calcium-binding protein [Aureimonas phyllosphaerae]|uniref:calcium-binding protein n=1 Tax=Aureimonas phyllosphaerae TaxID=1166078 RepID=UPI003A5C5F9D